MIELFYTTVGMLLDIICLTLPVLMAFNIKNFKNKLIFYISLYLFISLLFLILNDFYITKYVIAFFVIPIFVYKYFKIDFWYFYLFIMNFLLLFTLDTIGYLLLKEPCFLIYSIAYKLLIILFYKISDEFILNEKLKMKILSSTLMNLVIILSIIIGGIVWLKQL